MVAYNIGNEEPAIILKDKNKFENLKPTIWFEVEDVAIFYRQHIPNVGKQMFKQQLALVETLEKWIIDFENSLKGQN